MANDTTGAGDDTKPPIGNTLDTAALALWRYLFDAATERDELARSLLRDTTTDEEIECIASALASAWNAACDEADAISRLVADANSLEYRVLDRLSVLGTGIGAVLREASRHSLGRPLHERLSLLRADLLARRNEPRAPHSAQRTTGALVIAAAPQGTPCQGTRVDPRDPHDGYPATKGEQA